MEILTELCRYKYCEPMENPTEVNLIFGFTCTLTSQSPAVKSPHVSLQYINQDTSPLLLFLNSCRSTTCLGLISWSSTRLQCASSRSSFQKHVSFVFVHPPQQNSAFTCTSLIQVTAEAWQSNLMEGPSGRTRYVIWSGHKCANCANCAAFCWWWSAGVLCVSFSG